MKVKYLWIIVAMTFLCGCASSHTIGYSISQENPSLKSLGRVYIASFSDERPEHERKGIKGKLLLFSSKDKHFNKPVSKSIKKVLINELTARGFSIAEKRVDSDYRITGSAKHFQATMAPAKITFLPYLGSVSTIWAKDDFTIVLSIYIKMVDQKENTLIDQTFDVSEDMVLRTGLLNLARYSRGFNYKVKLLDEALKDVMSQIRHEIIIQVENQSSCDDCSDNP